MLEIVIGNAREWKAVTAIPWLKHYFIDTSPRTCAAIGKFLTSCSRMRGAEIKKSPDSRWGEVNVYRTDIIDDMERLLGIDPTLLASRFRRSLRNSWPRCLGRSTTMCFVISGKP